MQVSRRLGRPEASDLYFKIAPIAAMVKEYITAMEKSPLLEAAALDEEFWLLAEFNGAILAGRETQHGYKFVTWERDYNGADFIWEHYYMDNYSDAKQDFAIRANLIAMENDSIPRASLQRSFQLALSFRKL
jgi:hypothetical protein